VCAPRLIVILKCCMGKKKKSSGSQSTGRTRKNPLTGEVETVSGTKAGKRRSYLPIGHPLRTHDAKQSGKKQDK
jgi:hypothetical protein